MTPSPSCRRLALASGPVARLEFCAHCQVLSLHLGAVTLRLDEGAGESLRATLDEALRALRERPLLAGAWGDDGTARGAA